MQVKMRSVTTEARRAQIVAATVEVIAADGFAQASFARIAGQAGLSSTRLISYHFAGKDDLVAAVFAHVVGLISREVGHAVAAEATAAGRLRAYIESVVGFTDSHRAEMTALLRVVLAGALPAGTEVEAPVPAHLEQILRQGQQDGELRAFDPRVMAMTVQRAVEALPLLLQSDPNTDCPAFAAELVTLFRLATRREAA